MDFNQLVVFAALFRLNKIFTNILLLRFHFVSKICSLEKWTPMDESINLCIISIWIFSICRRTWIFVAFYSLLNNIHIDNIYLSLWYNHTWDLCLKIYSHRKYWWRLVIKKMSKKLLKWVNRFILPDSNRQLCHSELGTEDWIPSCPNVFADFLSTSSFDDLTTWNNDMELRCLLNHFNIL